VPAPLDWLGSSTVAAEDPSQALDALVDRARAALAGVAPAESSAPFVGEAADGLITAEAGAEGRLRSLTIDPKMLRQPIEDICRDVVTAVNAALDARPGRVDSGPLLEELRAVQEESVQQMAKISSAFSDALAQAIASRK
jgi:DNA-binding protein YbaB